MSTAQTCLALIDMHAPRLLGNKPTIASLRIDEAKKNAIRAQGFTIKDAPPSLAANTLKRYESGAMRAAFDEVAVRWGIRDLPKGVVIDAARRHGCSHQNLLNKFYKARLGAAFKARKERAA